MPGAMDDRVCIYFWLVPSAEAVIVNWPPALSIILTVVLSPMSMPSPRFATMSSLTKSESECSSGLAPRWRCSPDLCRKLLAIACKAWSTS